MYVKIIVYLKVKTITILYGPGFRVIKTDSDCQKNVDYALTRKREDILIYDEK